MARVAHAARVHHRVAVWICQDSAERLEARPAAFVLSAERDVDGDEGAVAMHGLLRPAARGVVTDDQRVIHGQLRGAHHAALAAEALLEHRKDRALQLGGEPMASSGKLGGVDLIDAARGRVRET